MMNSRFSKLSMAVIVAVSSISPVVYSANFDGPDSVENTIAEQKAQKKSWRESLAEEPWARQRPWSSGLRPRPEKRSS